MVCYYVNVTTRARYSLRAMIDIARYQNNGPVRAADIGGRGQVSSGYLERILKRLVEAGLVSSQKGPGGGYVLARPAASISLADVFRASGEELLSVPCICEDCVEECPLYDQCRARAAWSQVRDAALQYMEQRKLAEFVDAKCRAEGENKQGLRPLRSTAGSS